MKNQKEKFEIEKNNKMNVKPKFLNVMKRFLFTLMTLVALVLVANTTFAAVNSTVIKGGTYPYSINGITLNSDGHAIINYGGTGATFYDVNGAGAAVEYTAGSNISYTAGSSLTLTFSIEYSLTATGGDITVDVYDDDSGCHNTITLTITTNNAPSFDLTISNDNSGCQTTSTTTDYQTPASYQSSNTITYTVSKGTVTDAPATYTWGFTIDIPNTTSNLDNYTVTYGATDITGDMPYDVTGLASTATSADIVVTFYTTTGIADQTLTGTVSAGTVTDTGTGGATYDESNTPDTSDATILAMPSIGAFN